MFKRAPEERRLVLHAGPHKTATTYIQENLFAARDALEKAGWHYPYDPVDGRTGQHGLALEADAFLGADAPRRDLLDGWAKAARDHGHSLILSAEGFCRWAPEKLDQLAEILGFETYEVIYTVRDPLDLFASLWDEEVKHGRTQSFPERFSWEIAQPLRSRILNPLIDIEPWLDRDWVRLHVVPFDTLRQQGIDIYTHVTKAVLDVRGLKPTVTGAINQRYPIEVAEFLRFITLVHYNGAAKNGADLRLRFAQHLTPGYIKDIKQMMVTDAKPARRNVPVRGRLGFRAIIENELKDRVGERWTTEIPADEYLYSREDRVFPYYNAFMLSSTPAVVKAAEDILKKLFD